MAVPKSDTLLAPYALNFSTRLTASPTTFKMTAPQAAALDTLEGNYSTTLAAWLAAREAGNRSKSLCSAKDIAKTELQTLLRQYYAFIQYNLEIPEPDKDLIGVHIRKTEPTPIPPPSVAPGVLILGVSGYRVSVRFSDPTRPTHKSLPPGSIGLNVFSHVGTTPPTDASGWTFEGGIGKLETTVEFPASVAPGSKVFITGFFFNQRKQSGPPAEPASTYVQGGAPLPAAM